MHDKHNWGLHLQVIYVTRSVGAIWGPIYFLDLSTGSSFLWMAVTGPLLAFHWWQRTGLCKRLVCRRAAVELWLWGRRFNLFHGQLPLRLLGNVSCFSPLSMSLCQVQFNVFERPLDEDVVKLGFGSDYSNPKLYGVSQPQLMGFFRRNAVSIHPHTVQTLEKWSKTVFFRCRYTEYHNSK